MALLNAQLVIFICFSRCCIRLVCKKGAESLFWYAADAKETRALAVRFLPEQQAPSPPQLHLSSGHLVPLFPGTGHALPETALTIWVMVTQY